MSTAKVCPKCTKEMEIGNYTGSSKISWEKEEYSFLKQEGQKISTYACLKCGFIESYIKK